MGFNSGFKGLILSFRDKKNAIVKSHVFHTENSVMKCHIGQVLSVSVWQLCVLRSECSGT